MLIIFCFEPKALTTYKVRTHIYATLLNYLMIFDDNSSLLESSGNKTNCLKNEKSKNRLIPFHSTGMTRSSSQNESNLKVLAKNSSRLLKLICTDSCEGNLNITTMLGLSLLTKLMDMDASSNHQTWIRSISDKGYISCIINTIQASDNQLLEDCFHSPIVKSNKIVYIAETKLSFLVGLSKTLLGAQLLLKNNLVNTLINCSVYGLRAKFDRNLYGGRNSQFLIQLLHQYYQIFFPTLDLCISIINSIGYIFIAYIIIYFWLNCHQILILVSSFKFD